MKGGSWRGWAGGRDHMNKISCSVWCNIGRAWFRKLGKWHILHNSWCNIFKCVNIKIITKNLYGLKIQALMPVLKSGPVCKRTHNLYRASWFLSNRINCYGMFLPLATVLMNWKCFKFLMQVVGKLLVTLAYLSLGLDLTCPF